MATKKHKYETRVTPVSESALRDEFFYSNKPFEGRGSIYISPDNKISNTEGGRGKSKGKDTEYNLEDVNKHKKGTMLTSISGKELCNGNP